MSINFKNSLFKKVNATASVFDHSQVSQLHLDSRDRSSNNIVRGGIKMRRDYFDTSSSSSSQKSREDTKDHQKAIDIQKHIKNR